MESSEGIARLAVLETEMRQVLRAQEKFTKNWEAVDSKLDELLGLKQRGIGAFWLASALAGTGIIGALSTIFDSWKGG